MSVKLHSVCAKLHSVCEITQCAQNDTYSIGKNSPQLENFTLTPLVALATNMSCDLRLYDADIYDVVLFSLNHNSVTGMVDTGQTPTHKLV